MFLFFTSRNPCIRSFSSRRRYGRLQDFLQGLHVSTRYPHCRLPKLYRFRRRPLLPQRSRPPYRNQSFRTRSRQGSRHSFNERRGSRWIERHHGFERVWSSWRRSRYRRVLDWSRDQYLGFLRWIHCSCSTRCSRSQEDRRRRYGTQYRRNGNLLSCSLFDSRSRGRNHEDDCSTYYRWNEKGW